MFVIARRRSRLYHTHMCSPADIARLTVRELTETDWPLVKSLFGTKGACGGCWCMFWRLTDARKRWSRVKGAPNQQAFRKLVKSGKAHGILALDDREPVGWCSFGPKAHFPGLETTRSYRTESAAGLWAINCFYLVKEYRRIGLGQLLAGEAVKAIRRRGGKIVEAYPVTLTRNGKRLPPAFSFTGPEVIFTRLGFKEVQRLAPSRPVYRLDLG